MNRPDLIDPKTVASDPTSKAKLRLWLRLLKASRRIEGQLRERLRTEFDTTLPRFDVLAALGQHPDGLKMSDLSSVLRVSNGNVTGIVDRLADDGLVERLPVPGDRRAAIVRLTSRGVADFAEQAATHEIWIAELLGTIDDQETETLTALISQLIPEDNGQE